ncbi:hypothetical protein RYX36_009148, partial [Vicia faba]
AERIFALKVHYVLGVFNTHLALKSYMILFVHDQSTKLIIDIQPSKADPSYTTMKEERLFSLKVHYVLGVFNTHLALKTYMDEGGEEILFVHDQSTKLLIDIQPSKEDQSYTTMKGERDEGGEEILFVHDQSTKLLIDIQPSKEDQSYTT